MKKYPVLIQDEQKACGAFCIAMILQYYGYKEEIKEIKKRTRMSHLGISMHGMMQCLLSYNIEANAYEASLETLQKELKRPCILFMEKEGIGHYVVLYEIKKDKYIVADPCVGLVSYSKEDMNHYTQRCIMIHHVGSVHVQKRDTYLGYLKNLFFVYRSEMKTIIRKGILISILGYISSLFFKWVVDYVDSDSSFFIVGSGIIAYVGCEMMKSVFHYLKSKDLLKLRIYLDEDMVKESVERVMNSHFINDEDGYKHSELLSLFDLSEMSAVLIENVFVDGICIVVFILGMYFANPILLSVVLMMFVAIIFVSIKILKSLKRYQKEYMESYYIYSSQLLSIIKSTKMIQMNHLYKMYKHIHEYDFFNFIHNKKKTEVHSYKLYFYNQIIIYSFYLIIMFIGFYFYFHHRLSLGMMFMFYMLMTYCLSPLMNNIAMYAHYQHMCLLYEKLKKYKENTYERKMKCPPIQSICFDHIEYSYSYGVPIVEHLDWTIHRSVILSGLSGSGKSTLLKLLLGYDYNYSGEIYINDVELREIDRLSLYEHIVYLDEKPLFIEETLYNNFCFDDRNKIVELLKRFKQDHLIEMFDKVLNVEGEPLSLGQRQIVSLIRALLKKRDVYIFDEAFSHLDSVLLEEVFKYLEETKEQSIYIIVNHQINLMNMHFDCVIMSEKRIKVKGD